MKTKKIILYVLIGLSAFQFIAIGLLKTVAPFMGVDMFIKSMGRLHYDHTWTFIIGMLDLAGGIGLLFKKYRPYAALGIIFLMHGAIGSHATIGDPISEVIMGAGFAAIMMSLILVLEKPFLIQYNPNRVFSLDNKKEN